MTNCKLFNLKFGKSSRKEIKVNFNGGNISSDGGVLLLKRADEILGLTEALNALIEDPRNPSYIKHEQISLLRQRVCAIALGYEDLNDHSTLRQDQAIQTALNSSADLASPSTLCRFENRIDKRFVMKFHKILFQKFIESFDCEPEEIVLDFDATDDIVHGNQEGAHYHGYYGNYCFLPLYVFAGSHLLVSLLREGNVDGAQHARVVFKLLVRAIRKHFKDTKIIFRGDCGFNRHETFDWIEKQKNVYYLAGQPGNKRLSKLVEDRLEALKAKFNETKEKQKEYVELTYKAESWSKERRVVGKLEVNEMGENARFIVSNLGIERAKDLYEEYYCKRGDMENRIKEQQLHLFADRTSCTSFTANQFRLILSSIAYCLIDAIRRLGLKGTEMEKAEVQTIRLKLLKIGGVIVRNTRKIYFYLSSNYPFKGLFERVCMNLGFG